jgi:hypothetical protein
MTIDVARHWLALGAALWTVSAVGQPPGTPPPGQQPGRPPAAQQPATDVPDDDFIEFLGEDDHGDAAWSEMVKRAQPGAQKPAPPPPPPPQSQTQW